MHEVFSAWQEWWKDEKQLAEMAELMANGQSKLTQFGERNKVGAKNACERAHEHNIQMLYLKVFGCWRLDTKIELTMKKHQNRIDGKRQQLLGVQQMFRNFAKQLEHNIASGADSGRGWTQGPPVGYKPARMQK